MRSIKAKSFSATSFLAMSLWTTASAAIGVMLLAGCGGSTEGPGPGPVLKVNAGGGGSDLAGNIEADGSSTVYLISKEAAAAFAKTYPNVKIKVGESGTGGGFKKFVTGAIDISDASRPITPEEFEQCRKNKVSFLELPVAYDGLSFVVNPKNKFVDSLSVDDLRKIYLSDSPAAAKTWKDVNDAWPAEAIQLFAPGKNSGTYDYFMEVVGKSKKFRTDVSANEDDLPLVQGAATNEFAIAFFGYAYYANNKDKVRVVPIVNAKLNKPVEPSIEAIEKGDYAPFSRPLFIYVKAESLRQPQIKKFVEYYLDNAAELSKKAGYIPLPRKIYEAAKLHYQERLLGTCYLTEDGKKREGPITEVYKKENLRDVK